MPQKVDAMGRMKQKRLAVGMALALMIILTVALLGPKDVATALSFAARESPPAYDRNDWSTARLARETLRERPSDLKPFACWPGLTAGWNAMKSPRFVQPPGQPGDAGRGFVSAGLRPGPAGEGRAGHCRPGKGENARPGSRRDASRIGPTVRAAETAGRCG